MRKSVALALSVFSLAMSALSDAQAQDAAQPQSLAIIRFLGDHDARIGFPDGHIEYLSNILQGRDTPSGGNIRAYQTIMLMNYLSARGFKYAGEFNNGEQIVMMKAR